MFRTALFYSHDTSSTSGLRSRRGSSPDDFPNFVPMGKPTGPANIRPHDLPDEPAEGSGDDGDVSEG